MNTIFVSLSPLLWDSNDKKFSFFLIVNHVPEILFIFYFHPILCYRIRSALLTSPRFRWSVLCHAHFTLESIQWGLLLLHFSVLYLHFKSCSFFAVVFCFCFCFFICVKKICDGLLRHFYNEVFKPSRVIPTFNLFWLWHLLIIFYHSCGDSLDSWHKWFSVVDHTYDQTGPWWSVARGPGDRECLASSRFLPAPVLVGRVLPSAASLREEE